MTLLFKFLPVGVSSPSDDETVVICSTGDKDRAGDIVDQSGIDLTSFQANPVVLWQHDQSMPIARASQISVAGGKLTARVKWPAPGVSAKADEVRGLVKAGVISAVSIGFAPIEKVPLDREHPKYGPQRYVRSELLEFSFVSVPANANALVVQRSGGARRNGDPAREARLRMVKVLALAEPQLTWEEMAQGARLRRSRLLGVSSR